MYAIATLNYLYIRAFFFFQLYVYMIHLIGCLQIRKFYQSRKSERSVTVVMKGSHVPLYGGGASLGSLNGVQVEPVPLTLNFMVRARAYVLGRLVKPKFYKRIECSVIMDPKKMNAGIPFKNKCTYH